MLTFFYVINFYIFNSLYYRYKYNFVDNELEIIENNYINEIKDLFVEELIVLFDYSYIAEGSGKKFEDLDRVIDVSSINMEIVNGYYMFEVVILIMNEK